MNTEPEQNNTEENVPSSCKLIYAMLGNRPAWRDSLRVISKTFNENNTPENLIRAYIACEKKLEVSPIQSTPLYSIFVSRKQAEQEADDAAVLQRHSHSTK